MSKQFEASIPSYLEDSPSLNRNIAPPTTTRKQELPFGELTWEDFERLCYRLARLEAQHCQLYGERGENQQGIDLYAQKTTSTKYTAYQCKRENNFIPSKIKEAVTKFLEGEWSEQTDIFVLCTKESLKAKKRADMFKEQSEMLLKKGISFIKWDSDELSTKLKEHPKIVDDFFGRTWVEAFCGQGHAESLNTEFNSETLLKCYKEWLNKATAYFTILGFATELSIESAWIQLQASSPKELDKAFNADYIPDVYHQVVVIGKSGSGKSTLLQRTAHYLSNSGKQILWVRLSQVAKYFEQGKPFSEAILIDAAESSGLEISQLKRILANPNYLLADGLDECDFACLGVIAQELVNWSVGHSGTKLIITTRPDNYNAGLFPKWEHVELLQLASQDIKKSACLLLEAQFSDKRQLEEQLALFEQRLKVNRTASLAAQNPLFLGFLIQLSINGIELSQNRSGLYESIIELSYKQTPPNREFKVELAPPIAFRIVEIAGWILQNSPGFSERKLVEALGEQLKDELDLKLLAAQEEAQKGLDFWKERRIVECLQRGHQTVVAFVHLSFQEYTAGKYAISLTHQELHKWLTQVRHEPKWKEALLFAAGSGAAEQIVIHLLSLHDSGESTSIELILAAEALAEANQPSLELVKEVVKRLRLKIESPLSESVFESTDALSLLAPQVPNLIGIVAKSLFNHTQLWTRLSAMKLAMTCGEDCIDLEVLTALLNDIIAEPAQAPSFFDIRTRKPLKHWHYQNEIAVQGFQLLLKNKPDLITAKQIWNFISQGHWSVGTNGELRGLLSNLSIEKLEDKDSEEYEEWSLLSYKLIRPALARMASESDPKNLLRKLKQKEKDRFADQVFLETVLQATNHNLEDLLLAEKPRELIALGMLLTSMGSWESPIDDWNVFSSRQDLDAIEAVLRGMIAALDIDLRELALDAQWVLSRINHLGSYNLDAIETALNNKNAQNNTQGYEWAWRQLIEITKIDKPRYLYKIPKIFVEPEWERSKQVTLDPEKLICAVEYPSELIQRNAALLLLNGAAGDEGVSLAQKLLEDDD